MEAGSSGADDSGQSGDEVEAQTEKPWPHLDKFLAFKTHDGNVYVFQCRLCLPKEHEIRAHKSSNHNVKSHIKNKHPASFTEVEETCRAASLRGKRRSTPTHSTEKSTAPTVKQRRQQSIGESFGIAAKGAGVSQGNVDKGLVNMIVYGMYPLRMADCPWFREFTAILNPTRHIPSRRTVGRRVSEAYEEKRQLLIRTLGDVQWVATTADCWTAAHKAYLGMTVHWMNAERGRMSGVLGCVRLTGRHTYDVLAEAMERMHVDFKIESKVTMTTTDNARNFVKAFVQFGSERDLFPETSTNVTDPQHMQGRDEEYESDDEDEELVADVEYVNMEELSTAEEEARLAGHMMCGAHTWNLVATKDSEQALKNATFKKAYRAALGKAQALWNRQNQSTVAADALHDELKKRLVVRNDTRWNSMYDALVCLTSILDNKRDNLRRVMVQQGLTVFSQADVDFMKEYIKVMLPVATVLDKIQGDKNGYLGWLLPLCATTVINLRKVKATGLKYCNALVDALIEGARSRFDPLLNNDECLLAACFHPRFRLIWLDKYDSTRKERAKQLMVSKVEECLKQEADDSTSIASSEGEGHDFMDVISSDDSTHSSRRSLKTRAEELVGRWLEDKLVDSLHDATFMHEKALQDLFLRYNTAVPSSAAVERIFSIGKDILRAKRSRLSDKNFNMVMFLKGNQHLSASEV